MLPDARYLIVEEKVKVDEITEPELMTPLMYAASRAHLPVMNFLLNVGANANGADAKRRPVMQHCMYTNTLDSLKGVALLLTKRAKPKDYADEITGALYR